MILFALAKLVLPVLLEKGERHESLPPHPLVDPADDLSLCAAAAVERIEKSPSMLPYQCYIP